MASFNTDKEIQDFLEKQERWLADGIITQEEYNNAINDAKVGIQGYTAKLKSSTESLKKSFADLGSSMVSGEQGASVYNGAMKSGASVIENFSSRFGILGAIIGTLASAGLKYAAAVNEQSDKLFDTYKDLSRSGLANGMKDTFDNLQSMGYTMAEIGKMSSLIKENAQALAQFGGTAASGSKKFADLSRSIVDSNLGTEFQRMGLTIDDINKGISGYVNLQRYSGQLGKQNAEEMRASAAAYIERQDQLTKLTGLSADAQNKILETAYAEERWSARQYQLNQKGDTGTAELNEDLLQYFTVQFGPGAAKEFKAYMSGALNTEDAQKFARTFQGFAQAYDSGSKDLPNLIDRTVVDAAKITNQQYTQARLGNSNKIYTDFGELVKGQGRTYTESMAIFAEQAKKDREAQKSGAEAGVNNMVGITQNQRNQTQTTDLLTNKGIVPVTKGMEGLSSALTKATDIVGQLAGKTGSVGGGASATPALTSSPTGQTGKIIGAESNGANVANRSGPGGTPSSSAYGVGQMLRGTFEDLAKNSAPGSALYGKTFEDMKNDVNLQVAATEQYRRQNAAALTKAGFEASDTNIYLAHFLGTTGALRVLRAGNNAALSSVVSQSAMDSNPNLKSMGTVADLKSWASTKMSAASGGVLSGPKSGYTAQLHGTEAVVPLPDGKTIPVQIQGNKSQHEQVSLLSMELDKLDSMLQVMQKQNDISSRILQRQV